MAYTLLSTLPLVFLTTASCVSSVSLETDPLYHLDNSDVNYPPVHQFDRFAVFYKRVPNGKNLYDLYMKNDLKLLHKLAGTDSNVMDYDVYAALFYNADAHFGLRTLQFDSAYINSFLVRLHYFLSEGGLTKERPIAALSMNLIFPPAEIRALRFESDREALDAFNALIQDTRISGILVSFITTMISQLKGMWSQRDPQEPIGTLDFGVTTTIRYLLKTLGIVKWNLERKVRFVSSTKVLPFVFMKHREEGKTECLISEVGLAHIKRDQLSVLVN